MDCNRTDYLPKNEIYTVNGNCVDGLRKGIQFPLDYGNVNPSKFSYNIFKLLTSLYGKTTPSSFYCQIK